MKVKIQEILSISMVAFILIAVPLWIWWYDNDHFRSLYGPDARIFKITASCSQGRVTAGRVAGYNYWSGKFHRLKTIKVSKGERVVLVINSADATHSFEIEPELNVEQPIEMEGGHTKIVDFRADKSGSYLVECKSFCCLAHHGVFFRIEILDKGSEKLSKLERR